MTLITVDIGNTRVKTGIFDGSGPAPMWVKSDAVRPADYAALLAGEGRGMCAGASSVLCSVVPSATAVIADALKALTGSAPLIAGIERAGGLAFAMQNAEALGADRIATAAGALAALAPPLAVIDFGTATTVNLIAPGRGAGETGLYLGGAILPGLGLMSRSLQDGTAQLPLVELRPDVRAIGVDTETHILSGVVIGTAGAVERIIEDAYRNTGFDFKIAVTGGSMAHVIGHLRRVDLSDADLGLKGLRVIYEHSA